MTTPAPTTIDSKKPNTKQELIAANIKLLIEQLEAGHSDALTNYLTAMSRFHNYSFGNVLEIARQMAEADVVPSRPGGGCGLRTLSERDHPGRCPPLRSVCVHDSKRQGYGQCRVPTRRDANRT
ncbi:MAG TPA: hypothetical protein VK813_05285 [Edaphobacter sp.]|jgi:hypothetical protein|nr:hypothetical protein [Edaphobacter sp.]